MNREHLHILYPINCVCVFPCLMIASGRIRLPWLSVTRYHRLSMLRQEACHRIGCEYWGILVGKHGQGT